MATATSHAIGVDHELIFDVGMHRGQDTRFYLDMGYRVVAIEAEAALVAAARQAFAREIANQRLEIVHCVVAREDGPVPFWSFPDKDEWNTADPRHAEQGAAAGYRAVRRDLPGRTFASILHEFGVPYYLKIDIEGADAMCVEALAGVAAPPYLSLEFSRASHADAFDVLAKLHALGYRKFKIVDQALNSGREAVLPSGQRFRFEMGASGAFGQELPGAWRDALATAHAIERVLRRERLLAPAGDLRPGAWVVNGLARLPSQWTSPRRWRAALTTASWFDLHAALPT